MNKEQVRNIGFTILKCNNEDEEAFGHFNDLLKCYSDDKNFSDRLVGKLLLACKDYSKMPEPMESCGSMSELKPDFGASYTATMGKAGGPVTVIRISEKQDIYNQLKEHLEFISIDGIVCDWRQRKIDILLDKLLKTN